MIYHLPGLCFYFFSDFLWCYLNSQKIFKPITVILVTGLVCHILFSVFISKNYGFYGIAVSRNLTFLIMLAMSIYIAFNYGEWRISWTCLMWRTRIKIMGNLRRNVFTWESLPGLRPSFISQFMTLYLGSFKINDQTAANVAITSLQFIIVAPHHEYSMYAITTISHIIGQNRPNKIREIIESTFVASFLTVFSMLFLTYIFKNQIAVYYFMTDSSHRYFFIFLNLFILKMCFSSIRCNVNFFLRALDWDQQSKLFLLHSLATISLAYQQQYCFVNTLR